MGTAVTVGKGGVTVNTGKGTNVNVGHGGVGVHTPKGTNVNVGHGNVGVHTGKGTNVNIGHGHVTVVPKGRKPGGTTVNVGKGGVVVNTPHKKKPVRVNASPFVYTYAATDTQIRTDPNVALFFLEKDLKPGNKMTLHFTQTATSSFISRNKANSIPFTSAKLPSIIKHFSLQPDSVEAESMKKTLSECEAPAMTGERKVCATSLESMVEFTTSNLGTGNLLAVSTTVSKEQSPKQQYKIVSFKRFPESNMVVCHAQTYSYAVFYCHTTKSIKAYEITMTGEDGTKVEAVAVCHTDTAGWNPKHIAFKSLGVKPGTVPVCHFLPQGHIVWASKK